MVEVNFPPTDEISATKKNTKKFITCIVCFVLKSIVVMCLLMDDMNRIIFICCISRTDKKENYHDMIQLKERLRSRFPFVLPS